MIRRVGPGQGKARGPLGKTEIVMCSMLGIPCHENCEQPRSESLTRVPPRKYSEGLVFFEKFVLGSARVVGPSPGWPRQSWY